MLRGFKINASKQSFDNESTFNSHSEMKWKLYVVYTLKTPLNGLDTLMECLFVSSLTRVSHAEALVELKERLRGRLV